MAKNFYDQNTSVRGLYPVSRTEPDMRKELIATFQGVYPETPKAQPVIFRKMRTNANGQFMLCDCVDILTKEPDKDHFCPICYGEGYLWDEKLYDAYKVVLSSSVGLAQREDLIRAGNTNIPIVSFYFEYDLAPNIIKDVAYDKVIELVLDASGNIARPYMRRRVYRINTAIDFRSDHAKLEYWKLDCHGEQVKFLNGPDPQRVK